MAVLGPASQNPLGLHPGKTEKVRVKMRESAGLQGNTVYFDFQGDATATVDVVGFGGATNPSSGVILATATHNNSAANTLMYVHGVLAEDIAEDGEGWCYIRGVCQALIDDVYVIGIGLTCGLASELIEVTAGTKCLALTLEASTNSGLHWVMLDGIHGLGHATTVA